MTGEPDKFVCSRCGGTMHPLTEQAMPRYQTGILYGAWGDLAATEACTDVWVCEQCGKVEMAEFDPSKPDGLPNVQIVCPRCGKLRDFEQESCPHCSSQLN